VKVAILDSLAIPIFIGSSYGAPFTKQMIGRCSVFPWIHWTSSTERHRAAREILPQRSAPAHDGYSALHSMSSPVSAPDTVPFHHVVPLSDSLKQYVVCRTSKRALFHLIEDLWNTMLSMMK